MFVILATMSQIINIYGGSGSGKGGQRGQGAGGKKWRKGDGGGRRGKICYL